MADNQDETTEKALAYATRYIASYREVVEAHYSDVLRKSQDLGVAEQLLPLSGRELGADTSIAVLSGDNFFFLAFVSDEGRKVRAVVATEEDDGFTLDWALNTPPAEQWRQGRSRLSITDIEILAEVSIPGGQDFLSFNTEYLLEQATNHGKAQGNQDGEYGRGALPGIIAHTNEQQQLAGFETRYQDLATSEPGPQGRGREFEELWRDVLEFYGWKPKKFRISGEENDFTAIYQGNHILGEVRWFKDDSPMGGGKMREFLGKLDPRPRTIGLFVSHSGFDKGALSVARRAVNAKTVVLFSRQEIESIILGRTDPGDVFDVKLRDVYDGIFEQQYRGSQERPRSGES